MYSLKCSQNFSYWILKFANLQTSKLKHTIKIFGLNLIELNNNIEFKGNKFSVVYKTFSTNHINKMSEYDTITEEECKVTPKSQYKRAPQIKLNNGLEMPVFGLGTYQSRANEGEEAIKYAIDIGYRHIDTAFFYQNEHEVGKAVRDKINERVIKREDIFIVTKLWCTFHQSDRVEYACKKSLDNLGLDYIDLYLMHLPVGYVYIDDNILMPKDDTDTLMLNDVDYLDTWKAMEELVRKGYVKSIGISNFNSEQIDRLLENCEIKPVVNQVECSPQLNQKKLIAFCMERDIRIVAYCPLGRPRPQEKQPDFLYSEETLRIAEKYEKTPAQIILRYLIDIGAVPIPKSSNNNRILENFDVFDFQLNAEDIFLIDKFNTGERLVPFNLIKAQKHKYFPFGIEF